jgi:hypothetical protein
MIISTAGLKAERWVEGWIETEGGDTLVAEIRTQKYFTDKLICRVGGDRNRYGIDEVNSFQIGEELWRKLKIKDLDDQLVFAREEISGSLFETKITEVKCTCDDSYQSRKVWIWKTDTELFVFKKRHFGKGLINWFSLKKELARQAKMNDVSLPEKLKFDEVPELVSRLS